MRSKHRRLDRQHPSRPSGATPPLSHHLTITAAATPFNHGPFEPPLRSSTVPLFSGQPPFRNSSALLQQEANHRQIDSDSLIFLTAPNLPVASTQQFRGNKASRID